MKKINKLKIIIFCVVLLSSIFITNSFAISNIETKMKEANLSTEYREWEKLSDNEKKEILMPPKYDITTNPKEISNSITNPFVTILAKNANSAQFSLKDILGDAIIAKDQKNTNECWAFATLGALESTLSYNDYKLNHSIKAYDFSERHMDYATARQAFLNNEINKNGYTRNISEGGILGYAENYLLNGSGAIAEYEMPFENNSNLIDISQIKNKNVVTTVYDTDELTKRISDKEQLKQEMKEFIATNGGLAATLHGADLFGEEFNRKTGAIYTENPQLPDHAALIVGWDDNYSKDNFNENHKPNNDGAWIIKNSWGENYVISLEEMKKQVYNTNSTQFNEQGITNYSQIPDSACVNVVTALGFTYDDSKKEFSLKIGNNGFMYVSYEDAIIYSSIIGIQKAANKKDYNNIYQNDVLGASKTIKLNYTGKVYLSNNYNRTTLDEENLNRIVVYAPYAMKNCKVYVNQNGTDKSKNNLTEVQLKEGSVETNTIDINIGYHSIEFAEPIKLTDESFAVVIEYQSTNESYIAIEAKTNDGWQGAEINENESFIATQDEFEENIWTDMANLTDESLRGNLIIKAYTAASDVNNTIQLSEISVTNSPNKVNYEKGEKFDPAGMTVVASYNDGSKKTITDYQIINGNDLKLEQKNVTISYTENGITKTYDVPITVVNDIEKINDPTFSDFSKAKVELVDFAATISTLERFTLNLYNIKLGDTRDNYKYHYAITPSTSNTDISANAWMEIDDKNIHVDDNNIVNIVIPCTLSDLSNINDLLSANKLYLHVKENVSTSSLSAETIHAFDIPFENKFNNSNNNKSSNSTNTNNSGLTNSNNKSNNGTSTNSVKPAQTKQSSSADTTVAHVKLPKTGKWNLIILILVIGAVGTFAFIKYRNIDR